MDEAAETTPAATGAAGWDKIEEARAACFAAEALLFDRRIGPEPAAVFLERALGKLNEIKSLSDKEAPDWARMVADKGPVPGAATLGAADANRCLKNIRRALREAEKTWTTAHGANRATKRRNRLKMFQRSVLVAGVVALIVGLWPAPYVQGWQGTYYNMLKFQGQARVRIDEVLNFRWGKSNPMEAFPKDKFTVRWETCLEVPRDMEVRFQLGSDDGSRLYVNNKKLIDFWGNHRFGYKQKTTKLKKGFHYVKVDYMESSSAASVELRAGFDGKVPLPIKPSLLRVPNGENPFKTRCKDLKL